MADTAEEIVARWKQFVPPCVLLRDVDKVLACYFPGDLTRPGSGGSHLRIVHDPDLARMESVRTTGTVNGNLSIPVKRGREVKAVYIKLLIRAVETKREINGEIQDAADPETSTGLKG